MSWVAQNEDQFHFGMNGLDRLKALYRQTGIGGSDFAKDGCVGSFEKFDVFGGVGADCHAMLNCHNSSGLPRSICVPPKICELFPAAPRFFSRPVNLIPEVHLLEV